MKLRPRFWLESTVAALAAVLTVVTAIWPNWIELLFDEAPDQGSGEFEWAISVAFGILAVAMYLLARREYRSVRRTQTA